MKGLLLKDFYMTAKYCRSFLLIVVVFLAVSFFGKDNVFFILYPVLISSMIPVTLMSYDEHDKWNVYSLTLPYTRGQLVSAKYLTGLIFGSAAYVVSLAATIGSHAAQRLFFARFLFGDGRDSTGLRDAGTHAFAAAGF